MGTSKIESDRWKAILLSRKLKRLEARCERLREKIISLEHNPGVGYGS